MIDPKYECSGREDVDGCVRAEVKAPLPPFEWLAFTDAKAISYKHGSVGETVVSLSCKDGDAYVVNLQDVRSLLKEVEDLIAITEAVRDA